jgi:hypothetical protein
VGPWTHLTARRFDVAITDSQETEPADGRPPAAILRMPSGETFRRDRDAAVTHSHANERALRGSGNNGAIGLRTPPHTMRVESMQKAISVVVAAGAVALSTTAGPSSISANASAEKRAPSTVRATRPEEPAPLSSRTGEALTKHKIEFSVVTDAAASAAETTAKEAAASAAESFNFTKDHAPSEEALGRLTVPTYGKNVSDDPKAPKIIPTIDSRLVWFVVFDDVVQPVGGPRLDDKEKKFPSTFKAPIWLAVDAKTGQVLGGETLG